MPLTVTMTKFLDFQFIRCLRWKQTRKLLENPGKAKKIVTNHVMFKFPKNTSIFSKSPPLVITFLLTTRPSYSSQIILLFSYWVMVILEPVGNGYSWTCGQIRRLGRWYFQFKWIFMPLKEVFARPKKSIDSKSPRLQTIFCGIFFHHPSN